MVEYNDFSDEINKKIGYIQKRILNGEISLLDIELVPIFKSLKDSLTIHNIDKYSTTYKNAFTLLNQKFEELKILLNYLDNKEKFLDFIKSNPTDLEIYQLLKECWRKPFNIEAISLNFLESSKEKLCSEKAYSLAIEQINKIDVKENFLLEVPTQKFTEKMNKFFNAIRNKLPCSFDHIFEEEDDQTKIYENFVFLLHLLQLGKIKYQKETKFLYL